MKLQLLTCSEVILSFDTQATDVRRGIYPMMPGLEAEFQLRIMNDRRVTNHDASVVILLT